MAMYEYSEENDGLYYEYVKQFVREAGHFDRKPLKRYAVRWCEDWLEPEPFWKLVKEYLKERG
jgi:hypothetical protein